MNWLQRIFGRKQIHADLSAEIRAHLDEKVESSPRVAVARTLLSALFGPGPIVSSASAPVECSHSAGVSRAFLSVAACSKPRTPR